jgi:hypothetical protein
MTLAVCRPMSRFMIVSLFALIATTGCDSKTSGPGKSKSDPAVAKLAVPDARVLAVAPDAAADVTLQTGALDFELVEHAGTFTLRDAAYELTFSHKPEVTEAKQDAPSGVKLKTMTAMASFGQIDAYGLFLLPIPKNVPYNVEQGIRKARDGAFNGVGVKMISDVAMTVGGIPGRKATATGVVSGINVTVELRIAFDKPHHTMIGLMALTGSPEFPAATAAFLSSLQIKPGEAPPAGDGT